MGDQKAIRVLIVDDQPDIGKSLEKLLTGEGYIVVGKATDGLQAIEMTQSTRPDVVLMDIRMPRMDGIEATRRITECCPTPVVVLSAHEMPELVRKTSAAGAGAYLIKPAGTEEMKRAITIAMARFEDMMALSRLNAELQTEIAARMQAEERLQHRLELERLVSAISTSFVNLTAVELDAAINRALRAIGEVAVADRSYVFLFFDNGTKMDNTHEWCAAGVEPEIEHLKELPVSVFPWWMDRLERFESIHIPRVTDLPPEASTERETLLSQAIQSLIVVPLIQVGTLVGFLGFDSVRDERTWSDEDTALLKMVGEIFVSALKHRQVETRLFQSEKMAFLGQMAGGIAHELRNPLGIISANAQLLQRHPGDTPLGSECTQKIHTATQRASLIIERLLRFANPQGGEWIEVDLHAVLEETFDLLAYQMSSHKVTLQKELHCAKSHPREAGMVGPHIDSPRVYGNPRLLEQVFTDLILDACQVMPQGGTLTVTSRLTEARPALSPGFAASTRPNSPHPGVEIRFSDTRRDIPPERLSRIRAPFFTTGPGGKGLGLSASYSIIQQHQGIIEVEGRMGEGFTYIVWLPICMGWQSDVVEE
jgi:signal transduction histidine kinase/AmiR/NasT family two-component response regulator